MWTLPLQSVPLLMNFQNNMKEKPNIGKVDIEQNPILSTNYGITSFLLSFL